MALCDAPRQRDLRAVLAVFFADGGDGGVLDEFAHVLPCAVDGVLVAKGGVLLDVNALGFVVGGEGGLLQPGVEFDLVSGRDNRGFAQQALDFGVAEVGDADRFGFAALEGFFHGFPWRDFGVRIIDFVSGWGDGIDSRDVEFRDSDCSVRGKILLTRERGLTCVNVVGVACLYFVVFPRHEGFTSGERGGPVHEVKI